MDDTMVLEPPSPPPRGKGPKHHDGGPTRGAVILVMLLALLFGALAIVQGFANGRTNHHLHQDEACQAALQQANLNRNSALQEIQNDDRQAVNSWIHRVSLDVALGHVADIPSAYEAYRLQVQANDQARASLGALLSATPPPSSCRLPLGPTTATTLPTLATPTAKRTSTSLVPLPRVTLTFTRPTVTVVVTGPTTTFTAVLPGPTVTSTVTVTSTRTRTAHVRVTVTRTVTATRTIKPTPQKTKTP